MVRYRSSKAVEFWKATSGSIQDGVRSFEKTAQDQNYQVCLRPATRECVQLPGPDQDIGGPHAKGSWGPSPFLPSPTLPSIPLSFPSLPSSPLPYLSPFLPSPPLEVWPQIQLGSLGERCKLPQWGLGRSPSRQTIWCIFESKKGRSGGSNFLWSFSHEYMQFSLFYAQK